jgi:hypothetical protein
LVSANTPIPIYFCLQIIYKTAHTQKKRVNLAVFGKYLPKTDAPCKFQGTNTNAQSELAREKKGRAYFFPFKNLQKKMSLQILHLVKNSNV